MYNNKYLVEYLLNPLATDNNYLAESPKVSLV
jgi:hypothetical protein